MGVATRTRNVSEYMPVLALCLVILYLCPMLKVEGDVDGESKYQATTTDVVSSQQSNSKVCCDDRSRLPSKSDVQSMKSASRRSTMPSLRQSSDAATISSTALQQLNVDVANSKVCCDGRPRRPSKSGLQSMKSTSRRSTVPSLKQSSDTATVSSTALQQLNTDVANKTAPVRKSSAAAKKPTSRYKPAHHSAPFKTMPLPPGQSKFPSMSKPGSRKSSTPLMRASQIVEAKGIDRHDGKVSAATSSATHAVGTRRIVHNGGRTSVTSLAMVALNEPQNSFVRNLPGNIASEVKDSHSQSNDVGRADCVDARTDNVTDSSSGGIPNSGGISVHNVASRTQSYLHQTASTDDVQTFDAVIGRQSGPTSATAANDVSRRTEAVVQSQRAVNLLHTDETVTEHPSSFVLQRDGQVVHIAETLAVLPLV